MIDLGNILSRDAHVELPSRLFEVGWIYLGWL
jgi:hypothetical protein